VNRFPAGCLRAGDSYDAPMQVQVRPAIATDAAAVLLLWAEAGAEPSHTDDIDGLTHLLRRDPGALLVAEMDGRIVGSIIGAWDGWRGSIYRLAVRPGQRRLGVARRLLSEAEGRLTRLGARRLQAIVVEPDDLAMAFWRASDWIEQSERVRFVKG